MNWTAKDSRRARPATTTLLDMIDQGMISADAVAEMCLSYMSEADVADMMRANDLGDVDDEDTE